MLELKKKGVFSMDATIFQKRYNSSRANLLWVVVLTAVNLIILATGGESYFLFSASVPYILTATVMALCGMFPPEFYVDWDTSEPFFDQSFFYVALVISVVIIVFYLLCFLFSGKNRGGWLIAALVAFIVDTVAMFLYYGLDLGMLIDIVLHIYVVGSLISGLIAHKKLKELGEV